MHTTYILMHIQWSACKILSTVIVNTYNLSLLKIKYFLCIFIPYMLKLHSTTCSNYWDSSNVKNLGTQKYAVWMNVWNECISKGT